MQFNPDETCHTNLCVRNSNKNNTVSNFRYILGPFYDISLSRKFVMLQILEMCADALRLSSVPHHDLSLSKVMCVRIYSGNFLTITCVRRPTQNFLLICLFRGNGKKCHGRIPHISVMLLHFFAKQLSYIVSGYQTT